MLNSILLAVLPIILPPLVGAVGVFYKQAVSKLPANLQPIISELAGQAVAASEQSLSGQPGATKFAAASTWLSGALSRYGITLSASEIKSFIEEAVYDLKQSMPSAPAVVPAAAPVAAPQTPGA